MYAGVDDHVASLAALAQAVGIGARPLGDELMEMIRLHEGDLTVGPTIPAFDLMSEPMTAAEECTAHLLAAIATYARDARLDDGTLMRLMRTATVCAARFDSYLVERTVS